MGSKPLFWGLHLISLREQRQFVLRVLFWRMANARNVSFTNSLRRLINFYHYQLINSYVFQGCSQKKWWLRQCPWLNSLPRYLTVFYFTPSKRKTKTRQMTEASASVCLILATALCPFKLCSTYDKLDLWGSILLKTECSTRICFRKQFLLHRMVRLFIEGVIFITKYWHFWDSK